MPSSCGLLGFFEFFRKGTAPYAACCHERRHTDEHHSMLKSDLSAKSGDRPRCPPSDLGGEWGPSSFSA